MMSRTPGRAPPSLPPARVGASLTQRTQRHTLASSSAAA
jgi:hypothetical protein